MDVYVCSGCVYMGSYQNDTSNIHTHTHTHIHKDTHTHTRTHTHTHTHTPHKQGWHVAATANAKRHDGLTFHKAVSFDGHTIEVPYKHPHGAKGGLVEVTGPDGHAYEVFCVYYTHGRTHTHTHETLTYSRSVVWRRCECTK